MDIDILQKVEAVENLSLNRSIDSNMQNMKNVMSAHII